MANKQTQLTNLLFHAQISATLSAQGIENPDLVATAVLADVNASPLLGIFQNKAAVAAAMAAAEAPAVVEPTWPAAIDADATEVELEAAAAEQVAADEPVYEPIPEAVLAASEAEAEAEEPKASRRSRRRR